MKKKLALLIACILVSALAAGCGSSKKTEESSPSASSAASDVSTQGSKDQSSSESGSPAESSSESEGSTELTISTPSGVTIDESGNIQIDIDDISDQSLQEDESQASAEDSSPDTENSGTLSEFPSYQMIYLAPTGFKADTKLPACYSLTSAAELKSFISDNTEAYSLATEHTNDDYIDKTSFVNETKDMNEDYFKSADVLLVVTSYKSGTECDLGQVSDKNGGILVTLNIEEAPSAAEASYVCFIIPAPKGSLTNKTISTEVATIFYEE